MLFSGVLPFFLQYYEANLKVQKRMQTDAQTTFCILILMRCSWGLKPSIKSF